MPSRDILAECPRFNLTDCRCACCSTLMGEGATFYPRSACLRLGRCLFSVRDIAHFGLHFWHDLVYHKALFVHRGPHALQPTLRMFSSSSYTMALPIKPVPAIHVWRIQRAFRQAAARRMLTVALLMALHPRLGAESHPLNALPEALVRLVVE